TLLKQQIPDKPTWLLSSGCSRFVRLCSFDFLYPVRGTTSKQCGDSFPRCNVKNNAFAALKLYYSITWCMCMVDENTNSEMFRTISTRL
ncbi:hypothetical protein ALC60_05830, partial [Trachymyrmex zeteki]